MRAGEGIRERGRAVRRRRKWGYSRKKMEAGRRRGLWEDLEVRGILVNHINNTIIIMIITVKLLIW